MRLVPATGPWFMTYRVLPGTCGIMLSTNEHDVALSGGALGCAVIVGWRFRRRRFSDRKRLLLGHES